MTNDCPVRINLFYYEFLEIIKSTVISLAEERTKLWLIFRGLKKSRGGPIVDGSDVKIEEFDLKSRY
jgi:hypothetical protein